MSLYEYHRPKKYPKWENVERGRDPPAMKIDSQESRTELDCDNDNDNNEADDESFHPDHDHQNCKKEEDPGCGMSYDSTMLNEDLEATRDDDEPRTVVQQQQQHNHHHDDGPPSGTTTTNIIKQEASTEDVNVNTSSEEMTNLDLNDNDDDNNDDDDDDITCTNDATKEEPTYPVRPSATTITIEERLGVGVEVGVVHQGIPVTTTVTIKQEGTTREEENNNDDHASVSHNETTNSDCNIDNKNNDAAASACVPDRMEGYQKESRTDEEESVHHGSNPPMGSTQDEKDHDCKKEEDPGGMSDSTMTEDPAAIIDDQPTTVVHHGTPRTTTITTIKHEAITEDAIVSDEMTNSELINNDVDGRPPLSREEPIVEVCRRPPVTTTIKQEITTREENNEIASESHDDTTTSDWNNNEDDNNNNNNNDVPAAYAMEEYRNDWNNIWETPKRIVERLAHRNDACKPIRIHIPQPKDFQLQQAFHTNKFRRTLLFDKDYQQLNQYQPLLHPLDVAFKMDKDAMMAIQRAERLETLKAFCGSSHAFYEAVWMQLGTITLPVGQSGETKTTQIHLFDDSFPAGAVPTTDECLLFQIAKALDLMPNRRNETTVADLRHVVEQDEVGKDALTQAKLYYRGVGHIMASCLGTNGVISPNALPQLFQNVLIRNIKPSSPLYSFSELMLHAKELINEESLNAVTDEWGHELGIKHCMERILIDTRTIALESIRQGLTLNGLLNLDVAKHMPLDVVHRLTIGRVNVDVEEVIRSFKLDHEWCLLSKPLTKDQNDLLYTIIPDVIREKHHYDSSFLTSFLDWCTGQKYIPYKDLVPNFEIEFHFRNDSGLDDGLEDSLPTVKTCVKYIVLPSNAYRGNKEVFQKRLETAIQLTTGMYDT